MDCQNKSFWANTFQDSFVAVSFKLFCCHKWVFQWKCLPLFPISLLNPPALVSPLLPPPGPAPANIDPGRGGGHRDTGTRPGQLHQPLIQTGTDKYHRPAWNQLFTVIPTKDSIDFMFDWITINLVSKILSLLNKSNALVCEMPETICLIESKCLCVPNAGQTGLGGWWWHGIHLIPPSSPPAPPAPAPAVAAGPGLALLTYLHPAQPRYNAATSETQNHQQCRRW